MIKYRSGNILDVTSGIIVHGCNARGVMGAGVAKALSTKYPQILQPYRELCKSPNSLGSNVYVQISADLTIINAITQIDFGNTPNRKYVSYDAVDTAFRSLDVSPMFDRETDIVNIPRIGAGLGGGEWSVISSIINHRLKDWEVICWDLNFYATE